LEQKLCWIDGTPTHDSSESQRQCPKCRVKWSYKQVALEFEIFKQFCNGERANHAAENLGCSRNTVSSHFASFTHHMEELVAEMLIEESIATNPQTLEEVKRLEKALRVGNKRRRSDACRYLFLNSLDGPERTRRLFPKVLGAYLVERIDAGKRTRAFEEMMEKEESKPIARKHSRCLLAPGTPASLNLKDKPKKPGLMREIGLELAALLASSYPPQKPSEACIELGETWVEVWKACRDTIKKSVKR
jgi:hypothetical protein